LERQLPQIHRILRPDINEVLEKSQLIIVGQKRTEYTTRLNGLDGKINVLDLVRISENPNSMITTGKYQGISW
jgi:hypothetical protein